MPENSSSEDDFRPDGQLPAPDATQPTAHHTHPCPALAIGGVMAAAVGALPHEARDVRNPDQWGRRHVKLDGFDMLGDFDCPDVAPNGYMTGTSLTPINPGSALRLAAMSRWLARQVWPAPELRQRVALPGNVPISTTLDVLLAWFIQHPPTADWIRGTVARRMLTHPRGKPKTRGVATVEMEAIARGEDVEKTRERRQRAHDEELRRKLVIMETRDLTGEEIAGFDLSWIATGKLVIPKELERLMNVDKNVPPELTPPLPYASPDRPID